jgi:hypothetical protein
LCEQFLHFSLMPLLSEFFVSLRDLNDFSLLLLTLSGNLLWRDKPASQRLNA